MDKGRPNYIDENENKKFIGNRLTIISDSHDLYESVNWVNTSVLGI